jgi:hypothetical protein
MDEVDRLKEVIKHTRKSIPKFAQSIDVSTDTVYNILKRKTKITDQTRENLYKFRSYISIDWFENGTGTMIIPGKDPAKHTELMEEGANYSIMSELLKEKERYIKALEERISEQGRTIKIHETSIEALRVFVGSKKSAASG